MSRSWFIRALATVLAVPAFLGISATSALSAPPRLVRHAGPRHISPRRVQPPRVTSSGTLRDLLPYTATVDDVDFTFVDDPNPPIGEMNPALRGLARPGGAKLLGTDVQMNNTAGDAASTTNAETSIAAWGKYLVGGWNDGLHFGVPPGATGWGYSNDGGATWTDGGDLPPGCPTCQYYGDPVIVVDGKGNFYFSNLYTPDGNFATSSMSVNHGRFNAAGVMVWDPPVEAVSASNGDFLDKEWIAVDKDCGNVYMSYTRFFSAGGQEIEFIRSTDGGLTWSAPQALSAPTEAPQGSRPCVGPDHEVYVVYRTYDAVPGGTTHQRIRRSTDGGLTFGPPSDVDQSAPGAQFYENITAPCGFNRAYMLQLPSIDVDRSCTTRRGLVYVTWPECVDYYDDPLQTGADVAEVSDVANNTPPGAQLINIGDHISGSFSNAGDADFYSFAGIAGQTYEFTLLPAAGSSADGFLRMFCSPGTSALNRMALSYLGGGVAQIIFTVPSDGLYYIRPFPNTFPGGVQTYDLYTGVHTPGPLDVAGDHRDAVLAVSHDGGATWSTPKRVNDDAPLFDNSLPEVNVDEAGRLHWSWMDHRGDVLQGIQAQQFYTTSNNGGSTILPSFPINTGPPVNWSGVATNLVPNFGDYAACATDGVNYYATWADGRNGSPDAFMRQMSGGISLDCPPCPSDSACPGDTIQYVYHVCNNNNTPITVQYHITAGGGCSSAGSVMLGAQMCTDVPYQCAVPSSPSCGAYTLQVDAIFIGTDPAGFPGDTLCCDHDLYVGRGMVLTAQGQPECPPDLMAVGCAQYVLNYMFCNTGDCPDSVVCNIGDTQGWITGTFISNGYLLPGQCAMLKVAVTAPCTCPTGTVDEVDVDCYGKHNPGCGSYQCATNITCTGATPVSVSNVLASPDHGAIRVSWTSFVDGAAATFRLLRSATADGAFTQVGDDVTGARGADLSFRDAGVQPATEYYYKIAYRQAGDWTYTGAIRIKTPAAVFALRSARPNPFSGTTRIEYEIARQGEARLEVFNTAGVRVRTLLDGTVQAGIGTANWDGRSNNGEKLAAGTYFLRLTSAGGALTQRVTLVR